MDFDPYETWLGIPADRRPPTHYDLLGLAPYESNPVAIDQAALRRMGKVRQHQIGPHSDQSQEILSELARARLILMDPDRRSDYDAKLRDRGEDLPVRTGASEQHGNGAATLDGPCQGAPDVIASLALTLRAGDPSSRPDADRSKRPSGWKKAAFAAAHAALLGAFLFFFGPPNWKQKFQDLFRVDPDRLTPTPKPKSKPPAPSNSRPVVPPEPAPPPIVEPPRADTPGRGSEGVAPPLASLDEEAKGPDVPPGPGRAKPSETGADPEGRTTPPDDDAIAEHLRGCKATYVNKSKEAKDVLLKAIDRQYELVKKNPTLKSQRRIDQLRYIEDERRAFKDDDLLPEDSRGMNSARDNYVRVIIKAKDECLREYGKAVSEYRKKGNIARANAVQDEGQALGQRISALLSQSTREAVLLSTGEMKSPQQWHYTTVNPGAEWPSPQFDTSQWTPGLPAFGVTDLPNIQIRTPWRSAGIWLRTSVIVPHLKPYHVLRLRLWNDDDVEIYVNGTPLLQRSYRGNNYGYIILDSAQKALFRKGRNTLAVCCFNRGGGSGIIDVGLQLFRDE